jgi:hypothetical protein
LSRRLPMVCGARAHARSCLRWRRKAELTRQLAAPPPPRASGIGRRSARGIQQRVHDIAQERTAPPNDGRWLALHSSGTSHRLAPRRSRPPGRRLSASTPGTSVALAWLRTELPEMLRSASRCGDLHRPTLARSPVPARCCGFARCCACVVWAPPTERRRAEA